MSDAAGRRTTSVIRLVVGLGNPGKAYLATRHNIGRRVVDALQDRKPDGLKLLLLDTFMNVSGAPLAEAARKKGLSPMETLVILDDFELPLGQLRLRPGGSSGGHNGLKSVLAALGTQDVPRLRVGIGPVPEGADPADFVLQPFSAAEKQVVEEMVARAADAVRTAVTEGVETAMNRFNKKAEA